MPYSSPKSGQFNSSDGLFSGPLTERGCFQKQGITSTPKQTTSQTKKDGELKALLNSAWEDSKHSSRWFKTSITQQIFPTRDLSSTCFIYSYKCPQNSRNRSSLPYPFLFIKACRRNLVKHNDIFTSTKGWLSLNYKNFS